MPFTDETRAAAQEIIARYPEGRSRSALLPMLHLVQAEEGCVTREGVAFCAEQLGITAAEVSAVATFYTMYKRHPVGDWLVSVCTNLSCALLGGDEVYARLSKHLGVKHDQTTEDGTITLEHAECLAACDYAPVMTVNYEFFDQVDPDSAQEIVEALQRGERPLPTRGASLCTFADASRQLAGFPDPQSLPGGRPPQSLPGGRPPQYLPGGRPPDPRTTTKSEGVAGSGVGEPTVAGVLLAEAAGWSAEDGVGGVSGAPGVPDAPGLQKTSTGGK